MKKMILLLYVSLCFADTSTGFVFGGISYFLQEYHYELCKDLDEICSLSSLKPRKSLTE